MSNRFMFRAVVNGSCYTSDGEDKEVTFLLKNVAVYGDGTIGISRDNLDETIRQLGLSAYEQDTLIEYFEDNYGTSVYDWFVIDCRDIEQCTDLKDKNGNFVYENDILIYTVCQNNQDVDVKVIIKWNEDECCFELYRADGNFFGTPRKQNFMIRAKIIGNTLENGDLLK